MARQYSEAELQQIMEAERILRTKGLIVDGSDDKQAADHNAERIQTYFELNGQTPATVETILRACEQMRDQLRWLTPTQQEYRQIANEDPQAAQAVANWLLNQTHLVKDGDEGLTNQIVLLGELRGRDATPLACQQALGRASYNGKLLYYTPTPVRVDPRQHADDGKSFAPRSETNLSMKDHAARARQARPETTPAPTSPKAEPDFWETACTAMLAQGSHSCQANMRRVFDAKGGKSWREVHREMTEVKRSYENLVSYRY